MTRLLITGGAGALGSELAARLHADGHHVVVYDLAPPPDDGRAEWHRGDIRDGLGLVEALRAHRAEAVVHLASLLTLATNASPRRAVEINSLGMATALEAAAVLGVRRFVWASTAGVFSAAAGPTPIPDDAPYQPADVYGGTKILNETLADHYHRAHGMETVGFRFPLMMGSAQPTSIVGVLGAALIEKPVAGIPSTVPYADDVPSWLWIGDAARVIAMAAVAESAPAGTCNVAGDVRPIADAVAIVRELIPGAQIDTEPGRVGLEFQLETSRVEERFGFHPEWTLEDQLAELVRRARVK